MVREEKQRKRAHLYVYPCPHCLTKFPSPSARDAHARAVHEKWRDYKCPHCSSLFRFRSRPLIEKRLFNARAAHISAVNLKIKRSRGAK